MALRFSLYTVRPGGGHDGAMDALVSGYLQRCGRDFTAAAKVFRNEKLLLQAVAEDRRAGATLFWIADLGGKDLTTEAFAERIRQAWEGGTRHLLLAVGPADGWSAAARSAADLRLSLSAMTLPHELARLVLAEQIYRAVTILQGHPYHCGH